MTYRYFIALTYLVNVHGKNFLSSVSLFHLTRTRHVSLLQVAAICCLIRDRMADTSKRSGTRKKPWPSEKWMYGSSPASVVQLSGRDICWPLGSKNSTRIVPRELNSRSGSHAYPFNGWQG